MQSNEPTIINAAGVEMPVTNVVFNDTFVIAYTDTISVRFEKVGDELQNDDFKITGDLSGFMPVVQSEVAEIAIEDEAVDVIVDPATNSVMVGTTIGVDTAVEGGDTTVTETAEENAEVTQPVTTE